MSEPDDLLTAAQAADRASVNRRTITRWVESGRLTAATKLPGATGAWLFRAGDVDELAEQVAS